MIMPSNVVKLQLRKAYCFVVVIHCDCSDFESCQTIKEKVAAKILSLQNRNPPGITDSLAPASC